LTIFQNITAIGNFERVKHILFDQKNRSALLIDFFNDFENRANQ
jgi:hypothetical protein